MSPDPALQAAGSALPLSAFPATRWSLVVSAGRGDAEAQRALESLCRAYWQPLYFFARRQGHAPECAEDFTQDVFAMIGGGEMLQRVQPERGRFRSYLLGVMKHVMAREHEREQTAKRGGGVEKVSLDAMEAEDRYRLAPVDHASPEVLFDRHWAETVMARAVERLRAEYAVAGNAERFAVLQPFLVTADDGGSYTQTALALGVTEAGARSAVFKFRQRFAAALRAEVAETVADESETEEELRALARALAA